MITKFLNSFVYASRGVLNVWREENNFKLEVIAGCIIAIATWYFNFSLAEQLFCIVAIVFVLSAEMLNTTIEDLCNAVHPEHSPLIGKVKDMASGFVLVTSLGAFIVGLLIFLNHFS